MIRWRRLLLHDMGRKGLALGLAVLVWYQVNQDITEEADVPYTLLVQDAETHGIPSDRQILVRQPRGWILTEPDPESEWMFRFRGPGSSLRAFLQANPGVILTANLGTPEGEPQTAGIRLTEAEWIRGEDAGLYLEGVEVDGILRKDFQLKFEPEARIKINLDASLIPQEGSLPERFTLAGTGRVEPNQVELTGPAQVIQRLQAEIASAREAGRPVHLLEPVALGGARQDIVRQVGLDPSRQRTEPGWRFVRMEPVAVLVRLAVRVKETFDFVPNKPVLIGQAPDGSQWTADWSPPPWRARFSQQPGDLPLSGTDLSRLIVLLADLAEIPEGAGAQYDLTLTFALRRGFDTEERIQELRRTLILEPPSGEWKLTVRRVPEPGAGDGGG